ncbi:MAG: hypothetical protein ACI83N_000506 [Hydrogenophaga sp.]
MGKEWAKSGQRAGIDSAACDPGRRQPTVHTPKTTVDIFYKCARFCLLVHHFSFDINDLSWWHVLCLLVDPNNSYLEHPMKFQLLATAALICAAGLAHASPVVTASNDGTVLANAIAGSGITVSNVSYSGATSDASGTFTNGAATVGFDAGLVLTTGTVGCIPGPNNSNSCTGGGTTSSLKFDFTSNTGKVFFQYVFGSEEYNEFVNSGFNDQFELLLNGTNIALLPGAGGVVSINNVNCGSNSAFYRNNSSGSAPAGCTNLGLNIQYDGLTTILTAQADVLASSTNTFEFKIFDLGDSSYDSGVFIKAGSFSGTNPVPLPGTLALLGVGLLGLGAVRRQQAA